MAEAFIPTSLPPRQNPEFRGHEQAVQEFLAATRSGRLHHAWLLAGSRGIGKATLAFRMARFLLSGGAGNQTEFAESDETLYMAPNHPVFSRVASGGHTDLMTIARSLNDKTNKMRTEIVVDDVRRIGRLVSLTAGEEQWRIIIVDGTEDMNRNAANAILKYLEEPPPQTLFLLVSHTPARLLPTIRSRCRTLTMRPLPDIQLSNLIASQIAPELNSKERALLTSISEGSPGRASALVEQGGVALYEKLMQILEGLPILDIRAVHKLGDRVAKRDGAEAFRTLTGLLEWWLARLVCDSARGAGHSGKGRQMNARETALCQRLMTIGDLEHWAQVWEKLSRLFARAEAVNLDSKQVILNAFTIIEQAAGD